MPRPKSFEKETVLNQAMSVFWLKGYSGTTMIDIQDATGLKPGSIYDSFGDKHKLFLDVIDHYRTRIVKERLEMLNRPGSARKRLEDFFDDLVAFSMGDGKKLGCLMSNSAIELAPHDPDTKELVRENLVDIADALCDVIEQGIENKEFKTKEKPEDLARFLISNVQGLRVLAKSSTTEETLRTSIRLALKVLE